MSRKVLIISPFFPPSNAADMQRVRMSLPYYKDFGWEADVVIVNPLHSEIVKDELLMQSIPSDIRVHQVEAFSKKWTRKFGLGSLGLRSLWYYKRKVNQLLAASHFDLIYFSTTMFPVCILGPYWKKKYNVPYVIDMQDPWHSDHYKHKPKNARPPKYWFSYLLNKYLEPFAMKGVDGLVSVSQKYIDMLVARYSHLQNVPSSVITFGAYEPDMRIAAANSSLYESILDPRSINIVYIGRGGYDMYPALSLLFEALKKMRQDNQRPNREMKFYFVGTSYAPKGQGRQTIKPLAREFGVEEHIAEITDRIGYYQTLATLQQADALFVPGSEDPAYSASKIYPYLLTLKPLLAIFNNDSNINGVLTQHTENVNLIRFPPEDRQLAVNILSSLLYKWSQGIFTPVRLKESFRQFGAKELTHRQTEFFDRVILSK